MRSVRIVNTGSLFAGLATPVFSFAYITSGNYINLISSFPFTAVFFWLIYLNHEKKYKLSRFLFMLLANFGILVGTLMYGHESGMTLLFLGTIIFTYTVYMFEEAKQVAFFTLLPIVLYLIVDAYSDTYFHGIVLFPENQRKHISSIVKAFSLLSIGGICYVMHIIIGGMRVLLSKEEEARIEQAKLLGLAAISAGVAHEINNPLAIIRGRAEQSLFYLTQPTIDLKASLIAHDKILKNVDRIAAIVKSLKSLARRSGGDRYDPFSVDEILKDCLQLCQETIVRDAITLTYVPPSEEVLINCRPSEIMQVIINLLNNAADAVQPQAQRWIKLTVETKLDQVIIRVADSGPRIPKAVRSRVMEPFFTTKEVGKGMGIGLSIASTLIKNHGGELFLAAEPTPTCFVIVLPRAARNP